MPDHCEADFDKSNLTANEALVDRHIRSMIIFNNSKSYNQLSVSFLLHLTKAR
jgi:hypothetical protein